MVNLKKVVKMGSNKENKNKEDQKKYEEKVEKMQAACKNFNDEFWKHLSTPQEWQSLLKYCFGEQMAKNRLVSRTSRVLHDMSKKLSKFKHGFDPNKVEDYIKAFDFKAKTANSKDYIKRSAIDDKEVADFFNSEIPKILQRKAKEISFFKELFAKSKRIKEESRKSVDITNALVSELKETISDVKDTAAVKKELGEAKKQLQKSTKETENQIKNTEKVIVAADTILNNPKASEEKKQQAIENVERESKKLDDANARLDDETKKAEKIITELKNSVSKSEVDTFDSATGVFTVKTEYDFNDIMKYENEITKIIVEDNVKRVKMPIHFNKFKNLKEVILGSGCTSIKSATFSGCIKLTSINLDKVQKIGENAFSGCVELKEINLSNITVVEEHAFSECTNLTRVKLGNGCTEIRNSAFCLCENLETINLEKVQVIEEKAFYDCQSLKNLDLSSVIEIHEHAFNRFSIKNGLIKTWPKDKKARAILKGEINSRNSKLSVNGKTLTISGSDELLTLKISNAFKDHPCIENMIVENVQNFEMYQFTYAKLRNVNLDAKCKVIHTMAFKNCESLIKINLENVQRIGNCAFSSTALKEVNLEKIIRISSYAFANCEKLKTVKLGNNFKKISKCAFENCKSLSKINLENIEAIKERAFENCTALKSINLISIKEIDKGAFKGCTGLKTVTLPENGENAKMVKEKILEQTKKNEGIEFINDPDENANQKK